MGLLMPDESDTVASRLRRFQNGDANALASLLEQYRPRLRRMVGMRLDRRLQGRVDPSDVIQEAFLDAIRRAPAYVAEPAMPFYLWLRFLTGQRLVQAHRTHLGTQMRDAGQEVSLYRGALPQASSVSLAAQLIGRLTTPSAVAMRVELQVRLQEALNGMDSLDREVLTLRHFEELNNQETAVVLGLEKAAASNRYVRALRRLKDVLANIPGFFA